MSMSLKLLFFPITLLLAVFLSVVYIKPDIETILLKRTEEAAKQEALRNVESVEANVRAIAQSLDQRKAVTTLVNRYFPASIDQERSLDVINFLAQQAGIIVNGIELKENQKELPPQAAVEAEPVDFLGEASSAQNRGPDVPESYQATITVMGSYENLRNFFDRLHHTDRLRVMRSLQVGQVPDADRFVGEQEIIPAGFLAATLAVDFLYAPLVGGGNALKQSIFQKDTLDFSSANRLADFVNSPVGDLAPVSPGRTNPFEAVP